MQGDENGIYEAVGTVGPVSICFDVTSDFQHYTHGVYSRYMPRECTKFNVIIISCFSIA